MEKHLIKVLQSAFNLDYLSVINESDKHSGPATESHFSIIVVSPDFAEMRLINRHRKINELLREELKSIHALAMHTYTPQEWANKKNKPSSPNCMGGSKIV